MMKIRVQDFASAIGQISSMSKFIDPRGVLFESAAGALRIRSTRIGSIMLTTRWAYEGDSFLIDPEVSLAKVLKTCIDAEMELTVNDHEIVLVGQTTTYKFQTMTTEEYPDRGDISVTWACQMTEENIDDLKMALKHGRLGDMYSPALSCMHLFSAGGFLWAECCNGVSIYRVRLAECEADIARLVYVDTMKRAIKLLTDGAWIKFTEQGIILTSQDHSLAVDVLKVDEKYPDINAILNKDIVFSFSVRASMLQYALINLSQFESDNASVKMIFSTNKLSLLVNASDKIASGLVHIDYKRIEEADLLEGVIFNLHLLQDLLHKDNAGMVFFDLSASDDAVAVKEEDSPNLGIIMPMSGM